MRTRIPTSFQTEHDIYQFLTALHKEDLLFHPDDDATTVIDGMSCNLIFTASEAKDINIAMEAIHKLCNELKLNVYGIAIEVSYNYTYKDIREIAMIGAIQDNLELTLSPAEMTAQNCIEQAQEYIEKIQEEDGLELDWEHIEGIDNILNGDFSVLNEKEDEA